MAPGRNAHSGSARASTAITTAPSRTPASSRRRGMYDMTDTRLLLLHHAAFPHRARHQQSRLGQAPRRTGHDSEGNARPLGDVEQRMVAVGKAQYPEQGELGRVVARDTAGAIVQPAPA